MKKIIALISCVTLVGLFALTAAKAEEKKKDKKVTCPVAGKEILVSKAKEAKYKDGVAYVCCGNCKAKLEKEPAKFAAVANHQLVLTGQYKQTKCPLAGRPVNKKQTVEVGTVKVGLCCGGCKGKLAKAKGKAQIELAFNDKAFKKAFEVAKKSKK